MCILTFRIAAEVAAKNAGCTEVSDLTKCRRRTFFLIREENLTKRAAVSVVDKEWPCVA